MTIKRSPLVWLACIGFASMLSAELSVQNAEQDLGRDFAQTPSRKTYIDELTSTPPADEQTRKKLFTLRTLM